MCDEMCCLDIVFSQCRLFDVGEGMNDEILELIFIGYGVVCCIRFWVSVLLMFYLCVFVRMFIVWMLLNYVVVESEECW